MLKDKTPEHCFGVFLFNTCYFTGIFAGFASGSFLRDFAAICVCRSSSYGCEIPCASSGLPVPKAGPPLAAISLSIFWLLLTAPRESVFLFGIKYGLVNKLYIS